MYVTHCSSLGSLCGKDYYYFPFLVNIRIVFVCCVMFLMCSFLVIECRQVYACLGCDGAWVTWVKTMRAGKSGCISDSKDVLVLVQSKVPSQMARYQLPV